MCVKPIFVKNSVNRKFLDEPARLQVPCGKCDLCKKAKFEAWLFRLDYELKRSTNPLFITLTYATPHLPKTDNGIPTLRKCDVQKFLKRLRKHHAQTCDKNKTPETKLVYYAVGEYGNIRGRPHYHLILFNLFDLRDIWRAWQFGRIDAQTPRHASTTAGYVLKYISKAKNAQKSRLSEFSLMSKGIGANYLTPAMTAWHLHSPQNCYVYHNGFKKSLPKYFKEKIYGVNTDARKAVTEHCSTRMVKAEREIINKLMDDRGRISLEKAKKIRNLQKRNYIFGKRLSETF